MTTFNLFITMISIIATTTEKATANIHIQSPMVNSLKHVCLEQLSCCHQMAKPLFWWEAVSLTWLHRNDVKHKAARPSCPPQNPHTGRCHMSNPPILLSGCERPSPSQHHYRRWPHNEKYQPLLHMPDLQYLWGVNYYTHHQWFFIYSKNSGSRFEFRI